jgi:cholesterol transport system auxiliary component
LLIVGSVLSGCAAIPGFGPPPLDTYELSVPHAAEAGRHLTRTQVLVPEPTALKTLDGNQIVIKTGPTAIQYLSGAQWSDRLPAIVQARLAESFQKTGRLGGVGLPGEGLAIDYQVVADLRAFEIQVYGSTRAYVEIFVRLLNDRNGVVRASRTFTASVPVSGTGNDAFVAALDAAFNKVGAEIVDWAIAVM